MRLSIFALAAMISSAHATGIGIVETRQWHLCDTEAIAVSIALIFANGEYAAATDAWRSAEKNNLCRLTYSSMLPQEVVFRKKVDEAHVRVVRIADDANVKFYWLTLEPVTGEPVL